MSGAEATPHGGPESARREARLARLALIGAAVLFSTGGAAVKSSALSPIQVAGGRSLVAALWWWYARRTRQSDGRPAGTGVGGLAWPG